MGTLFLLGKLVQVIQNVQNNQALTIHNSGVSILNVSTFTQQTQAKVFVVQNLYFFIPFSMLIG